MSEPRKPYLYASVWWCEDEVCDCHQPKIERIDTNPVDRRFITRTTIWRGTFVSEPTAEECDQMVSELKAEAGRREIPLQGEGLATHGFRPLTTERGEG